MICKYLKKIGTVGIKRSSGQIKKLTAGEWSLGFQQLANSSKTRVNNQKENNRRENKPMQSQCVWRIQCRTLKHIEANNLTPIQIQMQIRIQITVKHYDFVYLCIICQQNALKEIMLNKSSNCFGWNIKCWTKNTFANTNM